VTSQARLVASGAIVQQAAQVTGLMVLLVVVTVLARRLSLAELGTYGLTATLAVYLLILKNSISGSAVRAMVAAEGDAEKAATFSTATVLYVATGVITGGLIAVVGAGVAEAVLDGRLEQQAQWGVLALGAVTAAGLAMTVNLDALRGALMLTRSAANEIAAVLVFGALMLGLALSDAPLWALIGGSGSIPLISGTINLGSRRRLGLPFRFVRTRVSREHARRILPTAGQLLTIELSNLVIYGLDRIILGLFAAPATIGLYEGPVRAHNVLTALNQSLGVTALPVASRYSADRDVSRMHSLIVRGSRYSLALFVPLVVSAMVLAGPALEVWLGERFRGAAPALTILTSYWLLYGALAVTPYFLVGSGEARRVGRLMAAIAAGNLAISLVLTPSLGLEGPAIGTAASFIAAFPFMLRLALAAGGISLSELAREAWLPAYSLGAALAVLLIGARALWALDSAEALLPVLVAGPVLYWVAYAMLWLSPDERVLVRQLVPGRS
jgi:O-antigen/teichoic acid export membrane protein